MATSSDRPGVTRLDDRRPSPPRRALHELASRDAGGRVTFGLAVDGDGGYVLCSLADLREDTLPAGTRSLSTPERVALAGMGQERPVLVVESAAGDYVVLVDRAVDLERHVPLGPDAADTLARGAFVRFGRRDDDTFALTAWSDEDEVAVFDPADERFADVPLVRLDDGDHLIVERGDIPGDAHPRLVDHLLAAGAQAGERHGVFANPFGEVLCVPEGGPLMPHEDVRQQAVLTISGALDGCDTLIEVVRVLRSIAARVEAAHTVGWRLAHPVYDDVALVEVDQDA